MTISAPEGDDASRLQLLLADIRDAFAKEGEAPVANMFAEKMDVEIASADLVKALVAIEGRPWAEMGKGGKPLTQNRLARMLKPIAIAPGFIGPENARQRGYKLTQFEEAFSRYLSPEGVSKRASVQNAANTGNGGESGLSSRRIQEHADWYSDQAYWHYSKNALDAGVLDAELRAILRKEVFPEHVELEFERVMKMVFAR
jgi:putative DNA primase/helicase